jgi:hypothetical protein
MWLQTVSESTVTVRIIGRYTMVASDQKHKFGELLMVDYPCKQGTHQHEGPLSLDKRDCRSE